MRDSQTAVDAVKRAMTREGLSPGGLSRRAGVSENTIRGFLEGRSWPVMATLGKIEKVFGWPAGRMEDIAQGMQVADDEPALAVESLGQAPIEFTFEGTKITVHPNPRYTPEQVRRAAREIFDASMERLAQIDQDEARPTLDSSPET